MQGDLLPDIVLVYGVSSLLYIVICPQYGIVIKVDVICTTQYDTVLVQVICGEYSWGKNYQYGKVPQQVEGVRVGCQLQAPGLPIEVCVILKSSSIRGLRNNADGGGGQVNLVDYSNLMWSKASISTKIYLKIPPSLLTKHPITFIPSNC